jgi:hypothetical protein
MDVRKVGCEAGIWMEMSYDFIQLWAVILAVLHSVVLK